MRQERKRWGGAKMSQGTFKQQPAITQPLSGEVCVFRGERGRERQDWNAGCNGTRLLVIPKFLGNSAGSPSLPCTSVELVKGGWWGQSINNEAGTSDIAKSPSPTALARTTMRMGWGRLWEWEGGLGDLGSPGPQGGIDASTWRAPSTPLPLHGPFHAS